MSCEERTEDRHKDQHEDCNKRIDNLLRQIEYYRGNACYLCDLPVYIYQLTASNGHWKYHIKCFNQKNSTDFADFVDSVEFGADHDD